MPDTDGGTVSASTSGGLGPDERAELQALRAQLAVLRDRPPAPAPRRRVGWRGPVATLLIIAGCLLAPVSVLGIWTANQVSDTGRYIANIEPLIHQPAIQNVLTDKITFQVTSRLNVAGYTRQAATQLSSHGLPRIGALLQTFSGSLVSAVDGFVRSRVHKLVTGPRFARAWVQANTIAHAETVKALSGQGGGAITASNGKVSIDLAPFIDAVKQDLSARGFTLVNSLPPIHPSMALFSDRALVQAQTGYRLVKDLKIVLPIMSLLLIGLGVYIARGHRRALVGAGLGLAGSMLLLGAGLAVFRGIYLNSVPASLLPSDAAAALFDTLVRFIKQGLRVLLVVGLVVAAGAFLTGPSVTAAGTRGAFATGLRRIREGGEHAGLRTGPVGRWTYAHRTALRIGAVALAALLFVFWGQPTAAVVLVIVILLLVVLGLIELIGRPPARLDMPGQGTGG
ncbi:MAG: hypothetical protein M3Y33_00340 [Actinomycetota bacterium]|nr:hypothetical protein [Actinomycetota bacterium]